MQHLDVISINIWQIIIALLNLTILFLLLKKFLFKPVERMLKKREDEINSQYEKANFAREEAQSTKSEYEALLSDVKIRADGIIKEATETANSRSEKIIENANAEAGAIVSRARADAQLEIARANEDIKEEIVQISSQLAEKLLSREINADDHKRLIDSFIDELGESDDIN